jgi:hypothetical protein
MRTRLASSILIAFSLALPLSAQTADEIINKYITTIGGMEKIQAIRSLRKSGTFRAGLEAKVVDEFKRPNKVRQEFLLQGMTGVNAYDGAAGWKIEPWEGKKDAESLSEDELKAIIDDSDFDGPLVNYREKGHKVEYISMDEVDGTEVHKLKVTKKSGDVAYYYMDTDYFVPIKIETKRMIRGAEREFETELGDYKEVNGWYIPHSLEGGVKGNPNRWKVTYDKIEANVDLADSRFTRPGATTASPEAPDASLTPPKSEEKKKEPASKAPTSPSQSH